MMPRARLELAPLSERDFESRWEVNGINDLAAITSALIPANPPMGHSVCGT